MHELLIQLQQQVMVPDRIPLAIAAILLTSFIGLMVGPIANNANSFVFILYSALWGRMGDRLDKTARPASDLVFRGFMLTAFALVLAGLFGKLANLAVEMGPELNFTEILIVSGCLTSGAVWHLVFRLNKSLKVKNSIKGVFLELSRSTRIDLNSTDNFGITRTALCFLAISFDKGMVTPVFWYVFGGLPTLFVYTTLSFLSWRFGKHGFTKGFGNVSLALERLMGYFPSILAGFLFTAASALTPTANLYKSLTAWWSVKDRASYEQGGICLSALAWPLNIVIGGPAVDITGSSLQNSWVGPSGATAQVDHNHIRRALYLSFVAHLLYVFILLCAYIYAKKVF